MGNISYFLTFLVVGLPFLFLPFVYNPYELPKFFVFVIGIIIVFFQFVSKERLKNEFRKRNPLIFISIAYIVVVCIANLQGIDPKTSFIGSLFRHQGFLTLLAGFLLFFVMQSLRLQQKEKIYTFFQKLIIYTTAGICLIALFQAFQFFVLHDKSVVTYQGRIIATFGNPNFLGGYLAVVLPFVLLRQASMSTKRNIFLRFLLIGCMFIVIFLTGSRAAFLATGIVFFIYAFIVIKALSGWRKIFPFLAMSICGVLAFQFYSNNILVFNRASFWDNRTLIWQEGIKAALKRPILGYGQENFELIFPKERKMKVDSAHNIFLEVLVSSGFIGLGMFVILLCNAFYKADTKIRLALIAFLVIAQFNPLSITHIALFWFLLGIL